MVNQMVKRTTGAVVDLDAPLMEAGLDSLGAVELQNQLQAAVGADVELPSSLIFEVPTARQLAEYFKELSGPAQEYASREASKYEVAKEAIRVVTACALLPAGVSNADWYGQLSATGQDATSLIPASRWDWHEIEAMALAAGMPEPIRQRMRYGAFVWGAELFDSKRFGVSHAEATAMDPQQRMLLETGYTSLHGAAFSRPALLESNTGVYLGYSSSDFSTFLALSPLGASVYSATGSSQSIASGRLSYVLGLQGACALIDTACSAGLVATSFARGALVLKESDLASVLAVNLILSCGGAHTPFAIAGMTSITGKCHTFDKHTDGYARSEAVGAAALSPRPVSVRELAFLEGAAVRCDGKSASLTAPNGKAQRRVIKAAMELTGSPPETLSLVEAHGTGTALGDPMEMGSVASVMLKPRAKDMEPMAIGSMKANAGHSEPGAGFSGLLKLTIGLSRGDAAPNAQLRTLNPQVNRSLLGLGCVLPVQLAALPLMSGGGVSSFGYSGTLAHAVLRRAAGGKGLEALSIAPVVYKWQSFPWFEQKSATAAPAVAVFATCWAAHQDLARQTSRLDSVLLFCGMQAVSGFDRRSKESAGDPSSVPRASSPRRAAVLLLPACSSVAPATGQQHMALVLVQHQASLPLLILTQGAYTSIIHSPAASAASGGSWGMARVVRLEQPSRHVLTIDV